MTVLTFQALSSQGQLLDSSFHFEINFEIKNPEENVLGEEVHG